MGRIKQTARKAIAERPLPQPSPPASPPKQQLATKRTTRSAAPETTGRAQEEVVPNTNNKDKARYETVKTNEAKRGKPQTKGKASAKKAKKEESDEEEPEVTEEEEEEEEED